MSQYLSLHQDPEGLVNRYLADPRPDLKDLIMVQYAGLVERVARKFSGIEAYEDLVQVGFIGLLNALTKFDPEAGVRFNTYAMYLVAGEIKHYLRDRSQTIRHPAWLQELRHRVNKAVSAYRSESGKAPTEREVADILGVSESAVREVFQTQEMLKVASLDAATQNDDDGTTEVDRLDSADFCPEQLSVEDRVVLEHAMRQLRDLEREVLVLFHFDSMSQTEIAARMGISCNYVSHILRQSLAKLRKILTTEEAKDRLLRRQAEDVDYDIIDADTSAYTESYFRARLEEELHRASADDSSVALIIIRFDGLEGMKKFYGSQSVIDFLADAAELLKDSVRRLDVVGRFGETGFGVILPLTGHNVGLVKQRLLTKAANWTMGRLGPNGGIAVQVAEASAPRDGRTGAELLAAAEVPPSSKSKIAA